MAKKTKKQQNKEFLEKIKTISIGVGAKIGAQIQAVNLSEATCFGCGEKLNKHDLSGMKLVAIGGTMRIPKKSEPENTETSFAA